MIFTVYYVKNYDVIVKFYAAFVDKAMLDAVDRSRNAENLVIECQNSLNRAINTKIT